MATPRFATPRNLSRDTLGPELVKVARSLGIEPMPWQRDHWDVMYEIDDRGKLWYREARITVPRQSGKTTSTLVRQVHRCIRSEALGWGMRPVAAFTAQHASDARSKMVFDWQPTVERAALAEWKRNLLSNGKESIEYIDGARMITFPPNGVGAHGQTFDLVDIDEAFAFPDNRAEQGARHAMITRKSPQIVIQSTAGTSESTYLRGKVDDGRQRVESGTDGHVYYLEYSVGPDDDIHDERHWHRWMPALGHTIDIENVRLEHDTLDDDEFYRAYGNGWTGSATQIIPAVAWAQSYAAKTRREGKVWMAVDVSPGLNGQGRSASIAVASYRGSEIHVEVIEHGPGLSWVADKLRELTGKSSVERVYVDTTGPVGQILPDIERKSRATVEVIDTRSMAYACGRFHQGVLDSTIKHRDQPMLNAAVEGAAKRLLEDSWAWKRRTSTADISPLVACTLAAWGAAINQKPDVIQMYLGKATDAAA